MNYYIPKKYYPNINLFIYEDEIKCCKDLFYIYYYDKQNKIEKRPIYKGLYIYSFALEGYENGYKYELIKN